MDTISSCSRRLSSRAGRRLPRTRIIGNVPTFKCRSEAPLSTAILSRSLTCIPGRHGPALHCPRSEVPVRYRNSRLYLSAAGTARCSSLGRLQVLQPAVRVRGVALDDVEEPLLERLGDRAPATAADLDLVHRLDGGHLDGGAHEEYLVGHVQH